MGNCLMAQSPPRLLIVSGHNPNSAHGVNAAPVVLFQLIQALSAQNFQILVMKVGPDEPPTKAESETAQLLSSQGVQFLETLTLPPFPALNRPILRRLVEQQEADFYPIVIHRDLANQTVTKIAPDALLVPWSESLTALFSDAPTVRIAYYGNPDPKNLMAQGVVARKSGRWKYWALWSLLCRQLTNVHLDILNRYHAVGDVAANDAAYYISHNHPNAFYVPNIWFDRFNGTWPRLRDELESETPFRIVGNVGKLEATANTLGMDILGRRILPRLAQLMGSQEYSVDILGSGQSQAWVHHGLNRPEVRCLGFVDDIDQHLLSSHIFLCANNASAYNVGHTRYLHAWSLGCCLIVHKNAALAMPEIVHDQNALLGETPEHMADLTAQALADKTLRRRLGAGGYETFRTKFSAATVGALLGARIHAALSNCN